ncbi:1-deoxy-D-xylulose-5-phosphate synthase N-terminal domain-containing protein [Streptomyces sp. NBC_01320]|uniref:1-deoxy-D-xylulose-5-phosphate synthase N-terminal domain-containing protein n=1 Tax=Streptomyces sp. NBC_01320 TaxID=2903824 RepID=UPI003FA3C164
MGSTEISNRSPRGHRRRPGPSGGGAPRYHRPTTDGGVRSRLPRAEPLGDVTPHWRTRSLHRSPGRGDRLPPDRGRADKERCRHKLLTRRQDFSRLRHEGGLSGCPCRAESAHEIVENQHASVSLPWAADGNRDRATAGHGPSCSTSWPAREESHRHSGHRSGLPPRAGQRVVDPRR